MVLVTVREEKQKETEREKEVEEAGGNVLKACGKKRLKVLRRNVVIWATFKLHTRAK
jgi:hypothetical protein